MCVKFQTRSPLNKKKEKNLNENDHKDNGLLLLLDSSCIVQHLKETDTKKLD